MAKKAVIACQVFYREVLDIVAEQEIRMEFLPQGLHNLPDETDMREEIQAKIDQLEAEGYELIILGYGYCSGGIEGLTAAEAKLVVPVTDDCIPLLTGQIGSDFCREATYYLSRGWIDCGGDSYKQYLFLTNQEGNWKQRFIEYENQNKNALVEWYKHPEYRSTQDYDEETARYITYECLKGYDAITLIDNGNLAPIHFDYAAQMHEFCSGILEEYGTDSLDYQVVSGQLTFLEKLFTVSSQAEIEASDRLKVFPSETPVEIE